jgi:YegS/Rv2252/BmrU family lipid kinase
MSKHIHVVVNPASGQNEPILNTINDVFYPAGVTWSASVTQAYGDAITQAREAAEGGADIVASYGGDGTVMEVVNGVMGTGVPLAVLPGGTGNIFSIELGIPTKLADAAKLIVSEESQVREIDVGKCGDNLFLLRVGAGFYAKRINMTSRELRDQYGKLSYFVAAMQAVTENEHLTYRFTVDGEVVEERGYSCMIQNAGNMGKQGVMLAPGISITDGLLDVILFKTLDFNSLSTTDGPVDSSALGHWRGKKITIEVDPPQPVVGDGETWGDTPITATVLPKAVSVITPAE